MNKPSRTLTLLSLTAAATLAACASMSGMHSSGGERVTLAGSNEVPPVATSASGTGTVTVGDDRSVSADIKVTGMTATAAHIHEGAKGSNGKVIVPLTKKGDDEFVAAPGAKLTDEQFAAYKAGNLYVNVHSAKAPGGEIRAQLGGK